MILLALNELNTGLIKEYIKLGHLNNFSKLFKYGIIETSSESKYDLLEPWIQWVTVQTGLKFDQHKVYRLGDIVNRQDLTQIFETLENKGLTVGCISPFNADNRLEKSNFFVPDPWTKTRTSGTFLIRRLSKTISRLVNTNSSGKVGVCDFFWLIISLIFYVRVKRWPNFLWFFVNRNKPGVKAAILDSVLLEVFVTLQKKYKPDYSHLFFNGGAHIQHHYMFNSKVYNGNYKNPDWYCSNTWDPVLMILKTYDRIIGDLLKSGEKIIGLTGLHQSPHEKQTFYWRPLNHKNLLHEMGLNCSFKVTPRMSRDFLIEFNNQKEAKSAEKLLSQFVDSNSNLPVFNIDNRGKSLFVEMTYDKDIDKKLKFIGPKNIVIENIKSKLSFVAIKNGKHHETGYLFSNVKLDLPKKIGLEKTFDFIIDFALEEFKNKTL